MDMPQDFDDSYYAHVKDDIIAMINGPLASVRLSPESALTKIRMHCRAENGYSDELVKSLPLWQKIYGNAEGPFEKPLATLGTTPIDTQVVDLAPASSKEEASDNIKKHVQETSKA